MAGRVTATLSLASRSNSLQRGAFSDAAYSSIG